MKTYHINYYSDSTAQVLSQGKNYTSTDEMSALDTWQKEFDVEEYPNRKFISMRIIDQN